VFPELVRVEERGTVKQVESVKVESLFHVSRCPAMEEARIVQPFPSVPGCLRFRGYVGRHAARFAKPSAGMSLWKLCPPLWRIVFSGCCGPRHGGKCMIPLYIWQHRTVETQVH